MILNVSSFRRYGQFFFSEIKDVMAVLVNLDGIAEKILKVKKLVSTQKLVKKFCRVYLKISRDIGIPFELEGIEIFLPFSNTIKFTQMDLMSWNNRKIKFR